jgi:predicted ATPase
LLYGNHDPGVCFMTHAAWVLWLLGHPDRAFQNSRDALALARPLAHPYTLAHALYFAAWIHLQRGEMPALRTLTDELMALAIEHEWPRWIAFGTALRGHLLVADGQEVERGIADIRQGVDAAEWRDHFHFAALFAEACGNAGNVESGLEVLHEELARARRTGARYYEAELHRLTGELRLKTAVAVEDDVEADFQMAIDIARRQLAKSLELRAVMSLSRLWQRQGKRRHARTLLTEAYDQFTEGFTTADLRKAKVLLEDG